jgi:raffinose/stachyose/melibiose transport system permease protein
MTATRTIPAVVSQPEFISRAPARRRRRILAGTAMLTVIAVFWSSPVLVLVATAVKTQADFNAHGAISLPHAFTFSNFTSAWQVGQFGVSFVNSGLVTLVKVPLGVMLAALLSYSLAKLRIQLRRTLVFFLLLGLTVPIFIAVVPVFTMLRQVGLIDNIWGLLPPYLAFGLPFEVLILTAFFRRIPNEMIEAARIDGASELSIFLRIVLPLSLPVLTTVAILDAVATWNELVMALILLGSPGHRTVPLSLLNFQGQFTTNFPALCAGICIALLPILVAYGFLQRWIVSGLTAGAIKG